MKNTFSALVLLSCFYLSSASGEEMKKADKSHIPEYSALAKSVVQGGTYKHYKGPYYVVLKVARSSETLEELVVYQALYGRCHVWVRPLEMFLEMVEVDGVSKPRFELVQLQ